ncbi:MAG TPA: hypothetical protein VH157_00455 [Bryobacteraceae bacterium]|jgi:hypothetical protein|nr:hypothetical protein [Bryobacteraceae bacterium]
MTSQQFAKAAGTVAVFLTISAAGILVSSQWGRAQDDGNDDQSKIQKGFDIAPVHLNLAGKNRALVGLGSYLVNGDGDCNGCHSAGPQTEFTPNGNPYLLPPVFAGKKTVNPATYLGGNRDFLALVPGSAHIISRNLTPDKTGMPEGGRPFSEFLQIIRTGVDLDHLHPTCPTGTINTGCVPFPFNGALLQIMPWSAFQDMTDHDIRAIYEYLSAIPCITGPSAPDPRHNDCP